MAKSAVQCGKKGKTCGVCAAKEWLEVRRCAVKNIK